MSKLSSSGNKARALAAILALMAMALFSCGLVSFDKMEVASSPGTMNEVLGTGKPIVVRFSIEPLHRDAEELFKLTCVDGTASGDFSWEGSSMRFDARPELKRGLRYTLSLDSSSSSSGLATRDGRSFKVKHSLSFFYESAEGPFALISYAPARGATVDVHQAISLAFSRPVDQASFKEKFTLTPSTDFSIAWSPDGRTATISPKSQWTALSVYSWKLEQSLLDINGTRAADSYASNMIAQEDSEAPSLLTICPALDLGGSYDPDEGADLNALNYRDRIFLVFNEDVDEGSLASAFSITPSISGHFLRVEAGRYVFINDKGYEAETTYSLRIKTSLRDLSGNALAETEELVFTPAVEYLSVVSVTCVGGGAGLSVTSFGSLAPGSVVPGSIVSGMGFINFTITFSRDILSAESRSRALDWFKCERYFPTGINMPSLNSISWIDDRTILVTYQGFQVPSLANYPHCYYKFAIIAGEDGVFDDRSGSRLKEEQWFILETAAS